MNNDFSAGAFSERFRALYGELPNVRHFLGFRRFIRDSGVLEKSLVSRSDFGIGYSFAHHHTNGAKHWLDS